MSSLTVENVCSRYVALQKLLIHAETENWNQVLYEMDIVIAMLDILCFEFLFGLGRLLGPLHIVYTYLVAFFFHEKAL